MVSNSAWSRKHKQVHLKNIKDMTTCQQVLLLGTIHPTVLSLVESKGKWKWRKAQLVSHGMRGSFWLVQTIFSLTTHGGKRKFWEVGWIVPKPLTRGYVFAEEWIKKKARAVLFYTVSSSFSVSSEAVEGRVGLERFFHIRKICRSAWIAMKTTTTIK